MSLARKTSATARVGLYALIIWAPIPLGSNRPIFWAVNGIAASLILVMFVFAEAGRTERSTVDWSGMAILAGGLALAAVWMLIQAGRWTPSFLHHPAWTAFATETPGPRGAISANPSATHATLAAFLPVAFLAVVAARIAFDPARARFILRVVVTSALILAIYGLVALNLDLPQILLADSNAGSGALTSFFVNRNTAATYLAIGLVAAFALIGEKYEKLGTSAARIGLGRALVELPRLAGFDLLAAFVLTTALINTASRAGTFSAGAGMITVALMSRVHGSAKILLSTARKRAGAVSAVLLVLAVFFTGIALAGGLLLQRLEDTTLDLATRLALYKDAIRVVLDRPMLGHGAGTFADIFPLFHSEAVSSRVVWTRAHNTYLQVAAEFGLPAFIAVLAFAVWWLARTFAPIHSRSRPAPAAIAAVSAAVVVAVHSLFDFSLQIQAVAMVFLVLAGAGFGEALRIGAPLTLKDARRRRAPGNASKTAGLVVGDVEFSIDNRPPAEP